MTDMITSEEAGKLLAEASDKAYDLEVVKWEGGVRCVYLNDFRVAGEKPWGGGGTIRRFKVRMADVMGAFRGTLQNAAPDLARTVIDLHAQLADAKAAQAMVVERAAEVRSLWLQFSPMGEVESVSDEPLDGHLRWLDVKAIRALADTDGLALVEALRTDVQGWADNATEAWRLYRETEADRDRLAAANAALEAQVARLVDALKLYSCEDGCNDCPEHERDRVGCGWTARSVLAEVQADARREGHWKDVCREANGPDVCEEPCNRCLSRVQADVGREGGE